ncbi:hypothetical protein ACFFJT_01345 [Dyella flava]|uniref:Uncharacterized protein n=1 Tax=Dyella flava TaxID=1920170 RepID=A0ABS2K2P5_9GAMM|nr:hypothetical protein [Dyella flava]MBM7125038.1 hypothetical protein [Dyella flava]GLQ52334.1 hypothetical protein GCM10010872_37830 [Dyella flava]
MSFGWTVLGTITQLVLAYFLFMVVVFSAGGIANAAPLGKLHLGILNFSMYLLPALCVLSAVVVMYLQRHGGSVKSYWWYALPLAATGLYLVYAIALVQIYATRSSS